MRSQAIRISLGLFILVLLASACTKISSKREMAVTTDDIDKSLVIIMFLQELIGLQQKYTLKMEMNMLLKKFWSRMKIWITLFLS